MRFASLSKGGMVDIGGSVVRCSGEMRAFDERNKREMGRKVKK